MSFLEATRIVGEFSGGESLAFLCGLSGTADPLLLYLKAAGAARGRVAEVRTLEFNTLGQTLLCPAEAGECEVFLLTPWDFAPEADWRSGVPTTGPAEGLLRDRASKTIARLKSREARLLYLPAPLPPLWLDRARTEAFGLWLMSEVRAIGATLLPPDSFALASYLSSGCPIRGPSLRSVADQIVENALQHHAESAKVLVTDLDNTVWAGVIGDDGLEGIHFHADGRGYPHFLYQSALKRLHADGVLLAAVTKNQPDVALSAFSDGRMLLREEHFIAIFSSWNAKSAQIRELASRLNLGLDAFVFVDDNPVELEEVALSLPAVRVLRFPATAAEIPQLLDELSTVFRRQDVSVEDRNRTELYRRRLEGMAPSDLEGADLSGFLRELEMTLTVRDHSSGNRSRAVQLINKTNQFNLNGRRVSDDEVGAILTAGGRLYGVTLTDRTGSHGEVLACLVRANGEVASLVMSCRVFQRRVEFAFLVWLLSRSPAPTALSFEATEKNAPIRDFLQQLLGELPESGSIVLDTDALIKKCAVESALFSLEDKTFS